MTRAKDWDTARAWRLAADYLAQDVRGQKCDMAPEFWAVAWPIRKYVIPHLRTIARMVKLLSAARRQSKAGRKGKR